MSEASRARHSEKPLKDLLRKLASCESGVTSIEYALLVTGISLVLIPSAAQIGNLLFSFTGTLMEVLT